jgi:tetratricopeptide (TPR) repeat protein
MLDVMGHDEPDTLSPPTHVEGTPPRRTRGGAELVRGSLLGRYVVLDRIGAGGMGIVYAAYDPDLDRRVALKLMHASNDGSTGVQARMLREAQALARLSHPNVVGVYDVGSVDNRVFLAMELVDGEPVGRWLETRKGSWREIVGLFAGAGRGLAAAHAAGIVHRDFKPSNVLVGRDGRARVLDFGLARRAGRAPTEGDELASSPRDALGENLTVEGTLLGTPVYMSPEAMRGDAVDAAGDQFSFCVALYEALYGARPFDAAIITDKLPALPPTPPDDKVPAWVRRVVARGLNFEQSDRFSSMDALLAALADDPAIRRRRIAVAAAAVVVVAGLVGGGLAWRAHVRDEQLAADPCAREAPLLGAWDEHSRAQLRAAFAKDDTGFTRAVSALDDAAHAWLDARARTCAGSPDHHAAPLQLQLACLDRQKDDLAALIALYSKSRGDTLSRMASAVRRVPGPAACADARSLSFVEDPPPALRPRVEAMHARLLEGRALKYAAKYPQAVAVLEPLVADARALGYPPFLAAALYELCARHADSSEHAAQVAQCDEAERASIAAGADTYAARAAAFRFDVVALAGGDEATVRPAGERARSWLDRTNDRDATRRYEDTLAFVDVTRGDYEASLEHFRRALAIGAELYGPASDNVQGTRSNYALALFVLGRFDEALAQGADSISALERASDTDSTRYATALANYGYYLAMIGRYADARVSIEHALRVLANNPKARGGKLCDLARVDLGEGEVAQAIAHCEEGLATIRAGNVGKFNLAINMDSLAAAYLAAHRFDDALATARSCVAEFRKDRAPDSTTIEMVPCLTIEGSALVDLGRSGDAIGELETALHLEDGHTAPPGVVGNIRFQLARALVASSRDRARADELTAAARTELARYPFTKPRLDELDAWANHGRKP